MNEPIIAIDVPQTVEDYLRGARNMWRRTATIFFAVIMVETFALIGLVLVCLRHR